MQIIPNVAAKMIEDSKGNLHDINHLLKVFGYARLIGNGEEISPETETVLEAAALVHDIACPLCRVKYGNANGKYQELEGGPLARQLLAGTGLTDEQIERVAFLVAHHHSPQSVDGIDYQILLEADYLVNADEGGYSKENIQNTLANIFRTETGKKLLTSIYLRD